jgi:hypothetical protein
MVLGLSDRLRDADSDRILTLRPVPRLRRYDDRVCRQRVLLRDMNDWICRKASE